MMIVERFSDDAPFAAGATMPAPRLVSTLLLDLRLVQADRSKQADGIREWLKHNESTPELRRDLVRCGFESTLPPRLTA